MNTNHIIHKARAILYFFLVFNLNGLTAQNQENYKYIISPHDVFSAWNVDILEVSNYYYVLSNGQPSTIYPQKIPIVTIYNKDLNEIERIQLAREDIGFSPMNFFYESNYFYVFGGALDNKQIYKPCLAKFDNHFNLVQPFYIYTLDDTLEYVVNDVLIVNKNEFVLLTLQIQTDSIGQPIFNGRIFHINNQGNVLQNVLFPNAFFYQDIVATDSHYFVSTWTSFLMEKFCKNSLNKVDTLSVERYDREIPEGTMISVGNQLIRSNTAPRVYDECWEDYPYPLTEGDRSIVFLNEDMSIKSRLIVGKRCANDGGGRKNIHYLNPDSIYYAYKTQGEYIGDNISIANFSWDGKLNFDYHLDIAEDSLPFRDIHRCKALSNGGLLVSGIAGKSATATDDSRGFLLLYHPPKNVGINELQVADCELQIYPNPANNQLRIKNYELRENTDIQIFDIVGKLLQSKIVNLQSEIILDVSHLSSGLYFLKIDNTMVKFVKE